MSDILVCSSVKDYVNCLCLFLDWLLDRFITSTNVCGDTMVTQIVAKSLEGDASMTEEEIVRVS